MTPSKARAAMRLGPLLMDSVSSSKDHATVPLAACHAPPLTETWTAAMGSPASASPADPAMWSGPATLDPEPGVMIATEGGVSMASGAVARRYPAPEATIVHVPLDPATTDTR